MATAQPAQASKLRPPTPAAPQQLDDQVSMTLRKAWRDYLLLVLAPCVLFLITVAAIVWSNRPVFPEMARTWFYINMALLAIGTPAAFAVRGYFFRGYGDSKPVPPDRYLTGMRYIWVTFSAIAVLSVLSVLITAKVLPNISTAMLVIVLFMFVWPKGHAMTRPPINEADPEDYTEPR